MEDLRRTVRNNSLFSQFSGVILMFGAGSLDELIGLDAWLLAVVGASLILYGMLLWFLGKAGNVKRGALLATVMDTAWVIGATVILVGFTRTMTPVGNLALLAVSCAVGGFAAAQLSWLRQTSARRS